MCSALWYVCALDFFQTLLLELYFSLKPQILRENKDKKDAEFNERFKHRE